MADGEKFEDYVSSFWHDPRMWRSDGRIHRHRMTAWPRLCIASRGKIIFLPIEAIVNIIETFFINFEMQKAVIYRKLTALCDLSADYTNVSQAEFEENLCACVCWQHAQLLWCSRDFEFCRFCLSIHFQAPAIENSINECTTTYNSDGRIQDGGGWHLEFRKMSITPDCPNPWDKGKEKGRWV